MSAPNVFNALLRLAWTGQLREKTCQHLDLAREVPATTEGCEECLKLGESWVHLRKCLICGHVGCCSSSRHDHARRHFEETGHPLIQPYHQQGMDWIWCYEDKALITPH
jgi:uncharacterized UBP type Zn finger protein